LGRFGRPDRIDFPKQIIDIKWLQDDADPFGFEVPF
jgi:hypothetical protein